MTDGEGEVVTAADTPSGDGGQDTDTELEAGAELEAPEGEQPDELEDVEYGGKTYKLPKEIKPALMMQGDYTRKTQEVAEQRKALETERETFKQQAETHQAHLEKVARKFAIEQAVKQYEGLDWNAVEAQDPFKAQSLLREYTMLKDQRDRLGTEITEAEKKRADETQQSFAKRYEEANADLAKDIKNWNDTAPKLATYAKASGLSDADIRQLAANVPQVKLLHKAFMYDQLVEKQRAAAKAAKAESEPAPEPLKQVAKGRSAPANGGLTDNLSADEWVKRRNAQVANERRQGRLARI